MTVARHGRSIGHWPSIAGALATLLLALGTATVGAVTPAPDPDAPGEVVPLSVRAIPGVALVRGGFSAPVFVTNAGDDRLFVVERAGRIRILREISGDWTITGTFLDLRGKVSRDEPEQGLLGLAFHPDYASNGLFYVDYTNLAGDVVVVEYQRLTAGKADPASGRRVLRVHQPFHNRNAGWIAFKGANLYVATGDGGAVDEPFATAQDKNVLLGKILRIDPIDPDGPGPLRYAIPASNPFVDTDGRDEIWAYGLRNAWRDSFDRLTGDLYIGDVGQKRYEEIDHAGDGRGRNFGWQRLEGTHLYPSGAPCTANCKTLPIVELRHSVSGEDNCAVTGGYVSRRPGAVLEGQYVFGEFCSGRIWSIPADFTGGALPSPLNTALVISSFGEGHNGTLYVVSLDGRIYRILGS